MGNRQSASSRNSQDGSNSEQSSGREENDSPRPTGYYAMLKNSYQMLVNAIIRPPRCQYDISQLGPKTFHFAGKNFRRTDLTLHNPRNLALQCSWWEPVDADRAAAALPCVVYMHGNSSGRPESLSCLSVVLSLGATMFTLDFAGSGKSDGEYVSLGAFEKDDLQAVIEHLRQSQRVSTIALWGRSMGAATALLHGERDPSIAGMVLDSSFSSLLTLAEEMVDKGRQQGLFAPSLLVSIAIKFVRGSVQSKAGFDIRTLAPIDAVDRCYIPALFIAAEGDNFVAPSHTASLYAKYGGDKNVVYVEGDHNSARPKYVYDSISIFLQSVLQIPYEHVLHSGSAYVRRAPWTYTQPSEAPVYGSMAGMSLDEMVALQLMEEYGEEALMGYDQQHGELGQAGQQELDMQNNLQGSLYGLLGGTNAPPQPPSSGTTSLPPNPPPQTRPSSSSVHSASGVIRGYSAEDADEEGSAGDARLPVLLQARKIKSTSDPIPPLPPVDEITGDDGGNTWECMVCTFINRRGDGDGLCTACGVGQEGLV